LGHPKCLGLPEQVNPQSVKWRCPDCVNHVSSSSNEMPMGRMDPFAALPNLIGKRPGNTFSEEEPNINKKMSFAGFPSYFY